MNGADGKDGINGKDGKNGTNGKDGRDGRNGTDGRDGTNGKDAKGRNWRECAWDKVSEEKDNGIVIVRLVILKEKCIRW